MGKYVCVAKIIKARKSQGRLVVRSVDGLPFLLSEGMTVHIVPPSLDTPRTVTVESVEKRGDDMLVAFVGIEKAVDLYDYLGRSCLIDRLEIPDSLFRDSPRSLIGCTVHDARFGILGTVREVRETPFQATLIVESSEGEVLIPLVDEFVKSQDDARGLLEVSLPEGLVHDEACESVEEEGPCR